MENSEKTTGGSDMKYKLSNGITVEYQDIEFSIMSDGELISIEVNGDFADIYNAHLNDTLPHINYGQTEVKPSDVVSEFAGGDYGVGISEYAKKMFLDGTMPEEMILKITIEK